MDWPLDDKKANIFFNAKSWGECKAEFYSLKSYLRWKAPDKKFKLVIGSEHAKHHSIVKELIPYVKAGMGKDELRKEREKIIKNL